MPQRYLELEELRLTRLVTEWLELRSRPRRLRGRGNRSRAQHRRRRLTLDLRLDRIDRLNDGSLLVIDYKSGDVSPKSWELPRPDDVQLPLYAGFALEDQELGGLVFAKVRAGDLEFAGRVGDAAATLFTGLKSYSSLVKNALTAEQLIDWREYIEQTRPGLSCRPRRGRPARLSQDLRALRPAALCRIRRIEPRPEAEEAKTSDGGRR